ncbi:MAG: hypothetical protein ACREVX_09460 [Clostridium sp.]
MLLASKQIVNTICLLATGGKGGTVSGSNFIKFHLVLLDLYEVHFQKI